MLPFLLTYCQVQREYCLDVLGKEILDQFKIAHANSRKPLDTWLRIVEGSNWTSVADLKLKSPSTDYVPPYFIFNVGGNKFRVQAAISFNTQILQVQKVGTHAEYDRWTK
jgi:mRNA interferase HigB